MQEYEDVKAGTDSKVKRVQGTADGKREGKDHPHLNSRKHEMAGRMTEHFPKKGKAGDMSFIKMKKR